MIAMAELIRDFVITAAYRIWRCKAKNRSTLMAVMINKETPQNEYATVSQRMSKQRSLVSSLAIYSGCVIRPTRKSEKTRFDSIFIDVVRMQGVLITAVNTKPLPRMDMRSSAALIVQFIMTMFLKPDWPSCEWLWILQTSP